MFSKLKSKMDKVRAINSIQIDADFNPSITHSHYLIRRGILEGIYENKHFMKGKLLDFGCGSKPYKPVFKDVTDYTGLDFYNEGHPHQNEEIDFFYDGKKIPFENNSFDSILSTEVFEHIFNPDELLAELNRVLKSEGHILITCPFVYPEHEMPFDYARYTQFALKHLLAKSGFEIIVFDKKGNIVETIGQLLAIYSTTLIKIFGPFSKYKLFSKYVYGVFVLFFNIFSITIGKMLPGNYHLYSTNVIVAKKTKPLI